MDRFHKMLWYLGSPYSRYEGGLDQAFQDVLRVMAELMKQKIRVFCPIVHTHHLGLVLGNSLDAWFWEWADEPFVEKCDGLIVAMLKGWQRSQGLRHEIALFRENNKPVHYIHVNEDYTVKFLN